MKRLLLSIAFLPFIASMPRTNGNIVEVRAGEWPINLEKNFDGPGTYALTFRDEQVMNGVVLDTLSFPNKQQLRYLEQALVALKGSSTGEVATFSNYSVQRFDKKFEGIWYTLRTQFCLINFKQTEADIMCKTIDAW